MALLFAATVAVGEPSQPHEAEQVKAAFIFNFLKYVHWNDRAEAGPLLLCVAGETPVWGLLPLLEGQRVREETIQVRRLARGESAERCRLLFIGKGEAGWRAALLAGVSGGAALTVSDRPGFVEAGGMIELFMEEGRVRFAVNLDAVRASRLTVSSRLLRLARRVIGEQGGGR